MGGAVLLLLLLAAYYLAGMYHSQPLMTFCLGALLLAGASLLQTRLLRRGLRVSFPRAEESVVQGEETALTVLVEEPPWGGTGRCALTLTAAYDLGKSMLTTRLEKAVGGGEAALPFSLTAPDCGLLTLRITRLEVRDRFSFFRARRRLAAETALAVYPPGEALGIALSAADGRELPQSGERPGQLRGEDPCEIRQLREYRAGDQRRRIHWNLSARTGRLWVKELEGAEAPLAALTLLWGEAPPDLRQRSAFFRLLHALVMGLLAGGAAVEVVWRDREGRLRREAVAGEQDCRRLLLALYRLAAEGLPRQAGVPGDRLNAFALDTALGWYWEDTLLYRFSPDALAEEIAGKAFSLMLRQSGAL